MVRRAPRSLGPELQRRHLGTEAWHATKPHELAGGSRARRIGACCGFPLLTHAARDGRTDAPRPARRVRTWFWCWRGVRCRLWATRTRRCAGLGQQAVSSHAVRLDGWTNACDPTLRRKSRLRVLRAEREWSQAELAQRVDVSRQTVNAIETGRYDPSLPLAFKLAQLFELTIEEIFDSEPGNVPSS